jgi:AcrR family transcriptional regulator
MAPRIDRRQQLLVKARDVFAKNGYHAATVDDIIAAAGVARGTFYLYFSDKRAAFEELVDRFFARIAMGIQRVNTGEPVESQVRANIRNILSLLLEDRAMAKILLADAVGVDPAFDAKLRRFYDEIESLFIESLIEGQSLGLVRPGDPRLMMYFTLGGMKETLFQVVSRGLDYPVQPIEDAVYSFLVQGCLVAQVAVSSVDSLVSSSNPAVASAATSAISAQINPQARSTERKPKRARA